MKTKVIAMVFAGLGFLLAGCQKTSTSSTKQVPVARTPTPTPVGGRPVPQTGPVAPPVGPVAPGPSIGPIAMLPPTSPATPPSVPPGNGAVGPTRPVGGGPLPPYIGYIGSPGSGGLNPPPAAPPSAPPPTVPTSPPTQGGGTVWTSPAPAGPAPAPAPAQGQPTPPSQPPRSSVVGPPNSNPGFNPPAQASRPAPVAPPAAPVQPPTAQQQPLSGPARGNISQPAAATPPAQLPTEPPLPPTPAAQQTTVPANATPPSRSQSTSTTVAGPITGAAAAPPPAQAPAPAPTAGGAGRIRQDGIPQQTPVPAPAPVYSKLPGPMPMLLQPNNFNPMQSGIKPINPLSWHKLEYPGSNKTQPDPCVGNPKSCETQTVQLPPSEPRVESAPPPVIQRCETTPITRVTPRPRDLDLLFVLDASYSIKSDPREKIRATGGKLGQLAREIKYFVKRLDPNTNYHIGVMPGHGPMGANPLNSSNPNNFHGRLLIVKNDSHSGARRDGAVIRSETVKEKCKGNSDCVEKTITDQLVNKFLHMPKDSESAHGSGADGETLMLGLYNSIKIDELRGKIQKQGLYRPGVTLAVIFISDEQDGCYDFEGTGNKPVEVVNHRRVPVLKEGHPVLDKRGKPVMKVEDVLGEDDSEIETLKKFCLNGTVDKTALTAGHVRDALEWLKPDKNFLVTAIVYPYNDGDKTEDGSTYHITRIKNGREGKGHGFIDLVGLTKGFLVDLANVDPSGERIRFSSQKGMDGMMSVMTPIGEAAKDKIKLIETLPCNSTVPPEKVDPSSVEVRVVDADSKERRTVALFSGKCADGNCDTNKYTGAVYADMRTSGTGKERGLEVIIDDPKKLNDILEREGVKNAVAEITFTERQGGVPLVNNGGKSDTRPKGATGGKAKHGGADHSSAPRAPNANNNPSSAAAAPEDRALDQQDPPQQEKNKKKRKKKN